MKQIRSRQRGLGRRLCTFLLAAAMGITLAVPTMGTAPEAFAAEPEAALMSSGFKMEDGIAVRFVDHGADTMRAEIGDLFSVQFWIKGIDPTSITIPLSWDPSVVQVADPGTGKIVSSGFKTEQDIAEDTGFQAGSKCYNPDYDIITMQPKNWIGRPVYSLNAEQNGGGYPYLNNGEGHYRFLYYTGSPTAPAEPQLFLEVFFVAKAKGNPNFRIATAENSSSSAQYDPASSKGMIVGYEPNYDQPEDTSNIVNYTDQLEWPEFKISDGSDLNEVQEIEYPKPTGADAVQGEANKEASLKDAKHLDCFPYQAPGEIAGKYATDSEGKILETSSVTVEDQELRDAASGAQNGTILIRMPDKIVDQENYSLKLSTKEFENLAAKGIETVYAETPYGYIGVDPKRFIEENPSAPTLTILVNGGVNWIGCSLGLNKIICKGFRGPVLKAIIPYSGTVADSDFDPSVQLTVLSKYVFGGEPYNTAALPLTAAVYNRSADVVQFCFNGAGAFVASTESAETFSDMGQAAWATDAVNALSALGIVHGTGNGGFSPNANVTREQFSIMLVSGVSLYQTTLNSPFEDVPKESPFYPYVASAYRAGAVKGVSEKSFGAKNAISRQDLAVMAYRGLTLSGVKLPKVRDRVLFADDAQIADYAKEAVYAMYEAGLISGVGDGRFDPQGNATRAAAAQITNGMVRQVKTIAE